MDFPHRTDGPTDDRSAGNPAPRAGGWAPSRRLFVNTVAALATAGGVAALSSCADDKAPQSPLADLPTPTPTGSPTPAPTITAVSDTDILVMMQQLHYLQAEFYSRAVLGAPLAASLVTGAGTLGTVTGGRTVTIADPLLADMLREVAVEKIDQVVRLRAALGAANPARPDINIAVDDTGTFTRYGRDSKDVVAPAVYDVYANQEQLLLGGFILEDAVITAWRGVSPLIASTAVLDTATALLATSSFHTGLIRSQIYIRGAGVAPNPKTPPTSLLRQSANRLSDLRDSYSPLVGDDKGVSSGSTVTSAANISPGDGEGEIYGRLIQQTINTFYMTSQGGSSGGFFPSGLNGNLRQS